MDFRRVCFHTPTIIVFKDQSFTSDKELTVGESLTICQDLFTKATSGDDDAFECFFDGLLRVGADKYKLICYTYRDTSPDFVAQAWLSKRTELLRGLKQQD